MANNTHQLDTVFQALSDPTRRAVLRQLNNGPKPVSELAAPFAMALPSFMQHLKMLEECGLVASKKEGRVRTYKIVPKQMKMAEDWLMGERLLWERRLDQMEDYLMQLKKDRS